MNVVYIIYASFIVLILFSAVCEIEGNRRFKEILDLRKAGECDRLDEFVLFPVYSIQIED